MPALQVAQRCVCVTPQQSKRDPLLGAFYPATQWALQSIPGQLPAHLRVAQMLAIHLLLSQGPSQQEEADSYQAPSFTPLLPASSTLVPT